MKPTNPRASHPQWSFALALAAGALITVGCVAPGTTGGLSPAAQQRLQHEDNRDLALDEIQRLRDQIGAMERQFSAIDQRIYALEDSIQQVHMRTRETAQTQPTVNPADLRRLEQSLNQLQTARAQDRQETVKAAIRTGAIRRRIQQHRFERQLRRSGARPRRHPHHRRPGIRHHRR